MPLRLKPLLKLSRLLIVKLLKMRLSVLHRRRLKLSMPSALPRKRPRQLRLPRLLLRRKLLVSLLRRPLRKRLKRLLLKRLLAFKPNKRLPRRLLMLMPHVLLLSNRKELSLPARLLRFRLVLTLKRLQLTLRWSVSRRKVSALRLRGRLLKLQPVLKLSVSPLRRLLNLKSNV